MFTGFIRRTKCMLLSLLGGVLDHWSMGDEGVAITCLEGVFFPVVAAADSVLPLNAEYLMSVHHMAHTYLIVTQKTICIRGACH